MYNTVVLWHVIYLSKGVSLTPYFSVDEYSMNMTYVCMTSMVKGYKNKMRLWNTNDGIDPIMANSKDGQGHMDKYLGQDLLILSQEMLMSNMKALLFII